MEDLLCEPGRKARPDKIAVVIRGAPGAGKTYVSKLLKVNKVATGAVFNTFGT